MSALQELPVVFTIHNMGYHGAFPRDAMKKIGLPESLFGIDAMEFYGRVNFLKGALIFSDYLTTVSPKYAEEIKTRGVRPRPGRRGAESRGPAHGNPERRGLRGVEPGARQSHRGAVFAEGFVRQGSPAKRICSTCSACRRKRSSKPVIGIVSRFAGQKGFDLIEQVAADLLAEDLAIVALGAGEPRYEKLFRDLAKAYPAKFSVRVAYDNILAHKVEAGADIFLMPSRYEPCGLNQIYSLKYGTVPVVRATGGLDDTIEAFDPATGRGTGFKFLAYDGLSLLTAMQRGSFYFPE